MKLWAHRGCSQRYPENTLIAFEKAAQLQGLAGIELDIQLTKDGQIVVIHDEKVDRTTDGSGWVRDYTLAELKRLKIDAGCYPHQIIPTMEEVFELLEERLKAGAESGTGAGTAAGTDTGSKTGLKPGKMAGLRLNIELKNSILPYDGRARLYTQPFGRGPWRRFTILIRRQNWGYWIHGFPTVCIS